MKTWTAATVALCAGTLLSAQTPSTSPPAPATEQTPQEQVIRPEFTTARLAVADFVARTAANSATESALKVFNQVLFDDLKFSAFFEIPSKSFYPLRPLRVPTDVSFENWQVPTLDVDFLVFGNMQVDVGRVVLEAYLFDIKTRQQVLGKRYTVPQASMVRRMAHSFSDEIVFRLSAGRSRGVSQTQISFSSKKGDSKELYVMDYDGFETRTITANGGINKFPGWSSDNQRLAFVTKLPSANRWELWLQELGGAGDRKVVSTPSSYVSSPAFSPDGSRIAFSARARTRPDADVYVATAEGTGLRNLTRHPAIDTSPAWSPTGGEIAFVSDRSGSPQIWVMESDGANVRRLVEEGGHCDSPDWSLDGRYVVYSWQAPQRWKHDVYIVEVATGAIRQLTSGSGSKENPHWSPDSRHIVFQSNRTGSKQIYIMNADGKNLRQITAYGINENPAWSGYRSVGAD